MRRDSWQQTASVAGCRMADTLFGGVVSSVFASGRMRGFQDAAYLADASA